MDAATTILLNFRLKQMRLFADAKRAISNHDAVRASLVQEAKHAEIRLSEYESALHALDVDLVECDKKRALEQAKLDAVFKGKAT